MSSFSPGRRRFTLGAAAAGVAVVIAPANILGQAAQPQPSATPSSLDQQIKDAMAKLSSSAQAEVEMKAAEVFRKYGDRLSDGQKVDIRKVLAETQEGLEKMRAFALENGDQPATVFHAYRAEEKP